MDADSQFDDNLEEIKEMSETATSLKNTSFEVEKDNYLSSGSDEPFGGVENQTSTFMDQSGFSYFEPMGDIQNKIAMQRKLTIQKNKSKCDPVEKVPLHLQNGDIMEEEDSDNSGTEFN